MFRKTFIALAAVATMGAAALAPTSASAWHYHPHGHYYGGWHRGYGWVAPAIVAGAIVTGAAVAASSCYVPQVVATPYGPRRVWTNVC